MSISPDSGTPGTSVSITGQGFESGKTSVMIGKAHCQVDEMKLKSNFIKCQSGSHLAGTEEVNVYVDGKGNAESEVVFDYSVSLTKITPTSSKSFIYYIIVLNIRVST